MATSINITNKPWCDEPVIVPVQEQLVKAAVLQDTHAAAPENNRLFSVEILRNIISSDKLISSGDQVDGNETSKGKDFPFKVVTHLTSKGSATDEDSGDRECHYASSAEEALQIYEDLYKQHASKGEGGISMEPVSSVNNSRWIGSEALRKTLLYRETYSPTEDLSPEVAKLVDDVWKEAMGKLKEYLAVPVASILPGQVAKAEAVLYRMWNILYDRKNKQKHEQKHKHKQKQKIDEESDVELSNAELKTLEEEFYGLIPHHDYMEKSLVLLSRVATKLDLCQMIRDVVYISEETGWQKRPTPIAKYRALRCYIQHLPSNHPEYEKIRRLVLSTMPGGMKLNTLRIFAVSRPPEEEGYCHDIGNDTLLFHATKPNNVLGILSRGLLMPKVVVEMFNGQRRDEGLLGPGLYFGDRISTCIQYTKNGFFSKTRMILVLKVALGATENYYEFNTKLQQAPDGFNSTHGVRASDGRPSEFTEDEFVVYSTKQQCIRYLVEFSFDGDDDLVDGYDYDEDDVKDDEMEEEKETLDKIDLADVQCCQDPVSRTATGLVVDNSREGVLLEQVHVRGHITDLAAKITVLQVYQNTVGGTDVPEARYVFPLDEKAAVCGFEAFINDRHVVGTVKSKEKAKEEYQEAVREGHGAYLMQEEASNVFSVSIGNLPPYAKVVIKITYVTELVEEDGGKMAFYLLGSVAPWLQEEIRGTKLTEEAQALVGVPSNETDRKESLQLTVEMPSDILTVQSPTHAIKLKREKTKATVTLGDGVGLGDGFQLLIGILNANKPRIWTEFDPSNNSYASMAVFYPTIQSDSIPDPEVVLLMDCSTSMKGEPKQDAKKICKMFLQSLPKKSRFNVITFGTDFIELFPTVEPTGQQQLHQAFEFIESARSIGGSSEGWRPLRSLSLLPMMKSVRNVLLVSDGHLTNEKLILEIASNYKNVNRIFTCGVGSTGNRHILRALADVSGGAFESFNPKAKSKWEGKISAQIDRCRQPSVSCVNAKWRTEENADGSMKPKDLIQVPAQTSSVFTGSKVLLYSLGPKVQEVQLNVEIAGKSVEESLKSPIEFEGSSLTLHRLAARALVRDYEFGSFHQDHALHETRMYDLTKYLTDLSIRLSIITPLTSFIAIEKRDRKTKLKTASPDVDKLLSMITRDDLESLHWTEVILEQEGTAESIVTKILRQAKIAQSNFSYASAEKYYNSALNMAKENMTSMQGLFKTCCLELSKFTMRVKGDAEKALQWIQPVVTHVTEQVEVEGEDEALDTTAREYSQLLQNKVRQGPAEKDVISRATGYVQRGPTAVRPISLAKKEIRKAVKYQSRRTFPFSSFLKPKKKEKKKMEPISFAMHSAAPAERRQFRGGVVSMLSKPKEERALDQRETELVDDENRATTLDQATLDELRRQATRLEEQLKKEESLLASVKVLKKKKSLGRSSLFGWGKGKSKREKTVVKSKGATISIGSGEKKYEEREEAARYLPSARLMKFAESDKKVCYSTAESRRPSPPAMDADEDRSLEASKDSLHEKEGEDETTYALSAEYSPPSSPALARARPIEVLAQGSPETSDDEFEQMYSLLTVTAKSMSLSSTPSIPEVHQKYGPARPESPPSPPLVLGAEAPLPSPSGPPQPPPLPPTSGSVLTRKMQGVTRKKMQGVTRRMLGVSPIPSLPSRSMPSSLLHPPPDAGPPMPGVSPPPAPPLPPRSMPSSLLHSPPDAGPPMPGVSPPPPPPPPPLPPPPVGLPTSRMPVVPPPPTAPRFRPPRPKPSPRLESTDLKSKDKSVADQDMMFDLMLLGSARIMASGSISDDDEDDILWEDGEPMEPKKTCKSPIIFKESKRTVSDFNHVMSLQNKDGMWSWEAHGHLIDDLFVIDFQDIYAFCCQLPILPYVRQNLRSILLTLLLLIYLEDVLPEVLPNLKDISPSNQDANCKFVNYTECTERAEEWLKRRETDQLLSLKTLLYNNLG